ncbi:MAG: ATP-binding cassette domain-containing protein, partial [Prosthecobacter sp.]
MVSPSNDSDSSPCGHTHTDGHFCWGGGGDASTHHHRLEVSNLRVTYREVLALDDIDFATECGRSIGLIGPNGAGKSTLLKSLAGLIPP